MAVAPERDIIRNNRNNPLASVPHLKLLRGHEPFGPRPVLYATELAELLDRARVYAKIPRGTGERTRAFQSLASDYGVTVRTIYRYLAYGTPQEVRVGRWSAWFAGSNNRRDGRPVGKPIQLTEWTRA
jgi:hypothetical protein